MPELPWQTTEEGIKRLQKNGHTKMDIFSKARKPAEIVFHESPEDTPFTKAIKSPLVRRMPASITQRDGSHSPLQANTDSHAGGHRARLINIVGMLGLKVVKANWQRLTDRSPIAEMTTMPGEVVKAAKRA